MGKNSIQKRELDVSVLNKGDYIEPESIEEITETTRKEKQFQFGRMALVLQILRESVELGNPLVVKCEGDGIRVLTDSEAVEYAGSRHEAHVRGLHKAMNMLHRVDESGLDDDQRASFRSEVVRQSRILQAVNDETKKLVLEGHVRSTPPMLVDVDSKAS